jgi:5'-deoxynucleotidase YfbR-like HD superfamily hydrolase
MDNVRSSLPESDPAGPVPESVSDGSEAEPVDLSHLPPEHRDVVRRLHRRVAEAVETIRRLRAENERLRRRVEELEAGPDLPEDETVLALEDDPEALRGRITRFIDAIDTYLERSPSDRPNAATDDGTDT